MLRRAMIAIQRPCAAHRHASPGRVGFVHGFLYPPRIGEAERSNAPRAAFQEGLVGSPTRLMSRT
jgi:hypothetical protein